MGWVERTAEEPSSVKTDVELISFSPINFLARRPRRRFPRATIRGSEMSLGRQT